LTEYQNMQHDYLPLIKFLYFVMVWC